MSPLFPPKFRGSAGTNISIPVRCKGGPRSGNSIRNIYDKRLRQQRYKRFRTVVLLLTCIGGILGNPLLELNIGRAL